MRLLELERAFEFTECMVEGCNYNLTYDIHRALPGKDGGEYVVGNMFAICPNHHAEEHRHLVTLEKVDERTLRIGKPIGLTAPLLKSDED
jgi:hypothetical protein